MGDDNFWAGTINLLVMSGIFIGFALWAGRPKRKQNGVSDE